MIIWLVVLLSVLCAMPGGRCLAQPSRRVVISAPLPRLRCLQHDALRDALSAHDVDVVLAVAQDAADPSLDVRIFAGGELRGGCG